MTAAIKVLLIVILATGCAHLVANYLAPEPDTLCHCILDEDS